MLFFNISKSLKKMVDAKSGLRGKASVSISVEEGVYLTKTFFVRRDKGGGMGL